MQSRAIKPITWKGRGGTRLCVDQLSSLAIMAMTRGRANSAESLLSEAYCKDITHVKSGQVQSAALPHQARAPRENVERGACHLVPHAVDDLCVDERVACDKSPRVSRATVHTA